MSLLWTVQEKHNHWRSPQITRLSFQIREMSFIFINLFLEHVTTTKTVLAFWLEVGILQVFLLNIYCFWTRIMTTTDCDQHRVTRRVSFVEQSSLALPYRRTRLTSFSCGSCYSSFGFRKGFCLDLCLLFSSVGHGLVRSFSLFTYM